MVGAAFVFCLWASASRGKSNHNSVHVGTHDLKIDWRPFHRRDLRRVQCCVAIVSCTGDLSVVDILTSIIDKYQKCSH